jgi:hypothetical protein
MSTFQPLCVPANLSNVRCRTSASTLRGQSKSSLDRVLLVISTCKFCRGCAMQSGWRGATSGRQGQWFLHHGNAPSHTSLVVQQFLSLSNHRHLRTSLRVTFGCSLSWKWPQRNTFRNHGGHRMKCDGRTPDDSTRSLPTVLPTMAGSRASVYMSTGPTSGY